jgi:hypothetical protein
MKYFLEVISIEATLKNGTNVKMKINLQIKETVSLDTTSKTLNVGNSFTPKATVTGSSFGVTWSSSNTKVAIVDSSTGKVTAKGTGTAKITATTEQSGVTATCTVTVKIPVTEVKLDRGERSLMVGDTFKLKPTINPTEATDKSLKWSSSANTIASVDQNGNVTAKLAGKTIITAEAKDGFGAKKICTVYVDNPTTIPNTKPKSNAYSSSTAVVLATAKGVNHQKSLPTFGNISRREKFVRAAESQEWYQSGTYSSSTDKVTFPRTTTNGWTKYNYYGYDNNTTNGAWCASFVAWCAVQGDSSHLFPKENDQIKDRANAAINLDWKNGAPTRLLKKEVYTPRRGDLIHFKFNDGYSVSHIGIVTACDGTKVYTIEGNGETANGSKGQVFAKSYQLNYSSILGYSTIAF